MSFNTTASHPVETPTKPRLRGWIHAIMLPLVLVSGTVLICLAHGTSAKASCSVFVVTAVMLFGNSAVYHLGNWGTVANGVLRRLDHSNIALIIAGTYTPLAVLLLPETTARILLSVVWLGALGVILIRTLWLSAPRWSYVPLYIALGWVAVWFLPTFWRTSGPTVVWLLAAGGISYTLGAVVYGLKRPNPWPRWFGFHEIFHSLTVVGFTCHLIAVYIAAIGR